MPVTVNKLPVSKRALINRKSTRRVARDILEYRRLLEGLTYKQLLRINSAVTATTTSEIYASRKFYRSLTPPESRIVKLINNTPNAAHRKIKLSLLNQCILKKNEEEVADVNIDALLGEAKNQGDV